MEGLVLVWERACYSQCPALHATLSKPLLILVAGIL